MTHLPPGALPHPGPAGGVDGSGLGSPLQHLDAWLRRHAPLVDAVVAALLFLVLGLVTLMLGARGGPGGEAPAWLAGVGMPAAFAVRRRWPVASAVVINALALAHWAAGQGLLPVDLIIYLSVYSTTVHAPRWARRLSLSSALLGSALVAVGMTAGSFGGISDSGRVIGMVAMFVTLAAPAIIAWALGLLRRSLQARWEAQRERAARLELERHQQSAIAAGTERARIAREMHDVVAHSLSVIVAQADGGRYAARADPAVAEQVLETIATTARDALADTRRILGVLRGDAPADTAPQPGVAAIEHLVRGVRESGLAVELVTWGAPQPLPAAADLAMYRVCQEALTNVLKHAGPANLVHARVDIAWHPGALVVRVDDDGRGAAATSDGAGHGQLGMRERVALFGGTLEAGPRPGGGYRVSASIPLAIGRPYGTVSPGGTA